MPITSQPQPTTGGEIANPETENTNDNNPVANNSTATNNQPQVNPEAATTETSQPNYEVPADAQISGKVGKNGKNQTDDISLVQKLLHRGGLKNITVSGQLDAATEEAITSFKMVYGLVTDFCAIHPEEFHILQKLTPNSLGAYKRKGVFAKVIDTPDAAPKMAALYDFISKNNSEKEANAEPQQENEAPNGELVDLAVSPSSYEGQHWKGGDDAADQKEVVDFAEKALKMTQKHSTFKQIGFESGKDLLSQMEKACEGGKEIRYMAFFGHAGADGLYGKEGVGLQTVGNNPQFPNVTTSEREKGGRNTSDLAILVEKEKIKFHKDGIILFLNACNTYHDIETHVDADTGKIDESTESFAREIAIATQTPVVGAISSTGSSIVDALNTQYSTKSHTDPEKNAKVGFYLIIPLGKNKGVHTIQMGTEINLEKAKEYLTKYRDEQKTRLQRALEKDPKFKAFVYVAQSTGNIENIEQALSTSAGGEFLRQFGKQCGYETEVNQLIELSKPLPPVQPLQKPEPAKKSKK